MPLFEEKEEVLRITCIFAIGKGLSLDMNKKAIVTEKQIIFLPEKEFQLLSFLVKNKGKPHTTEELLLKVWKDEHYCTNIVTQYILKLRIRLNDHKKEIVQYIPNTGYIIK